VVSSGLLMESHHSLPHGTSIFKIVKGNKIKQKTGYALKKWKMLKMVNSCFSALSCFIMSDCYVLLDTKSLTDWVSRYDPLTQFQCCGSLLFLLLAACCRGSKLLSATATDSVSGTYIMRQRHTQTHRDRQSDMRCL